MIYVLCAQRRHGYIKAEQKLDMCFTMETGENPFHSVLSHIESDYISALIVLVVDNPELFLNEISVLIFVKHRH